VALQPVGVSINQARCPLQKQFDWWRVKLIRREESSLYGRRLNDEWTERDNAEKRRRLTQSLPSRRAKRSRGWCPWHGRDAPRSVPHQQRWDAGDCCRAYRPTPVSAAAALLQSAPSLRYNHTTRTNQFFLALLSRRFAFDQKNSPILYLEKRFFRRRDTSLCHAHNVTRPYVVSTNDLESE